MNEARFSITLLRLFHHRNCYHTGLSSRTVDAKNNLVRELSSPHQTTPFFQGIQTHRAQAAGECIEPLASDSRDAEIRFEQHGE